MKIFLGMLLLRISLFAKSNFDKAVEAYEYTKLFTNEVNAVLIYYHGIMLRKPLGL